MSIPATPSLTLPPLPVAQNVSGGAAALSPHRLSADALPSTAPAVAESPPPGQPVDPEKLETAVQEVQKFTQNLAKELQFNIDKDSGRTVVKVVDASTQEVIRQIPSEEVLAMAKALGQIQGLLIKQKA
jgi:flagellar protein FlaG